MAQFKTPQLKSYLSRIEDIQVRTYKYGLEDQEGYLLNIVDNLSRVTMFLIRERISDNDFGASNPDAYIEEKLGHVERFLDEYFVRRSTEREK